MITAFYASWKPGPRPQIIPARGRRQLKYSSVKFGTERLAFQSVPSVEDCGDECDATCAKTTSIYLIGRHRKVR